MTSLVNMVSATRERLLYLMSARGSPFGVDMDLSPYCEALQNIVDALMLVRSKTETERQSERILEVKRRIRSLLFTIENEVELYGLQHESGGSGSGYKVRGIIRSCIQGLNKSRAKLDIIHNQLSDAVVEYNREQAPDLPMVNHDIRSINDIRSIKVSHTSEKAQRLVSRANYSNDLEHTVGLEEAISRLVKVLVPGDTDAKVVIASICGEGGIGKTTLANKVYNQHQIRSHFECFAWVYVGINWTIRDILVNILHQLLPSRLTKKNKELMMMTMVDVEDVELAQQVHEVLQENVCLIVLDNCCTYEFWDSLRMALPTEEENASRFILTTRQRDLAVRVGAGFIWDMQNLDPDQSWELFSYWRDLAFKDEDGSDQQELGDQGPELEQNTRSLISSCRGLPLAIILVASMLRSRTLDLESVKVSLGMINSSGRGPESLSYYSLPLGISSSFLYLGNFPNNSGIQVDKLCELWIAEGLISAYRESGETTMDLAGRYFDELLVRSLVILHEDEVSDVKLMSCHVHDLIRDFSVSLGEEEGFYEVMESSINHPRMRSSAQRCAIYLNRYDNLADVCPSANLRSLLILNSDQSGQEHTWRQEFFNFNNHRWLRVLDFDKVCFQDGKLPDGVSKLFFLRYLSFRGSYLEDLPSFVGEFLYLETLDLRVRNDCTLTISNVIWKLKRLRHLYFPLAFRTPDHCGMLKLDGLNELETLEGLDTNVCSAEDLIKLTNLRSLAVTVEGKLKDLVQIINCINNNSSHLSRTLLDIKNFDCYSEERVSFIPSLFSCGVLKSLRMEGHMGKVPEVSTISSSFTEIVLSGSEFERDPMETLEKLPNLRILVLEIEAFVGKNMNCSAPGFPELRCLKLSKLYSLEAWEVAEGAMHKLFTLEISKCRRMEMLPEGLKYVSSLRKLKISMMPEQFVGRLHKVDGIGGEDLHKINSNCAIKFGSDDRWL
ncbi:probable disease resistance RPP8-like protein 2 [Coffea arabica]|uniref:Probable disease resistance RPP8-like protein 2 n=1 Tax=Coffea arabica TaxID=13443 RepID=A0A6P6X4U5_COFAR